MHVPMYPYLIIVKGDEILLACNQHSNEDVTHRKHVIKYKNVRKFMVEFLMKLSVVAVKLLEITQFLYYPLTFLTNRPCAVYIFIEKSMVM